MLLLSHTLLYWVRIKSFMQQKILVRAREYWNSQSGDWHWLTEKPRPIASINRYLWRVSVPSLNFHVLLTLSGVIATLGLLANSVAIIIGAMIIAPLMGPIIGLAYAMAIGNRRLLRRSSLTILTGTLLTVATAFITTNLIGLKVPGPEILARANPTLIDLGVALAAGAAGSYATSRNSISSALPGVAIAVALVPPVSVIGIGFALGEEGLAFGSLVLFITNLTSIIFSGGLVFLLQRYGSLQRAKRGLLVSIIALFGLGLPLGFSLNNLLIKENVRRQVGELIRYQTDIFDNADIQSIVVRPSNDTLVVRMEVAAPLGEISQQQIESIRNFLSRELDKPVDLEVQVMPMNVLKAPS